MAVAAAQAPSTARADARDELVTGDEVKEYFHEGELENEKFSSMDLHDIKTELEKDADAEAGTDYSCSQTRSSSLTPPSPSPGNPTLQLRPALVQPMLYANGFMIPQFSGSPSIYPVAAANGIRSIKMEQHSHPTEWVQSTPGMGLPYSYQSGLVSVDHGVRQQYPYMHYVSPLPYERQVAAFGAAGSSCQTQPNSSVVFVPPKKEVKTRIKKPLNAFMLFMKKNRGGVIKQHTLKESAAINKILGQMWHKLTKSEQAVYYQMAQKERERHMELYPGWSARDNYALRKNRKSKKAKPSGEMSRQGEEIVFEPDSEDAQFLVNGQAETENKTAES